MNQVKHSAFAASRRAAAGDLDATRNYLRLARLARAQGLPELAKQRVAEAQAARRSWHRNRGVLLRHFHGRRARGRA